MEIESRHISKAYSKEFINVSNMGGVLVKNPRKPLRDMFIIYPVLIILCVVWAVAVILYLFAYNKTDILILALGGVVVTFVMVTLFYVKMLTALKKNQSSDRHVKYIFSEEGLKYDDGSAQITEFKWDACQCLLIIKEGMYFIPNDNKGVLIAMPAEFETKVKDFIRENKIDLEIVH